MASVPPRLFPDFYRAVLAKGMKPTLARLTLAAAALAFGGVPVGTTSNPLTTTLTNHEKIALNVSAITIIGANSGDFAQSNTCLPSVAAGGTCTITVKFTPSGTGSRVGTLVVTDDASTSPQSVKLSGSGQ